METMRANYMKLEATNRNKNAIIFLLTLVIALSVLCNVLFYNTLKDSFVKYEELSRSIEILADKIEDIYEKNEEVIHNTVAKLSAQTEEPEVVEKDILQVAGEQYGVDPKLLEAIERLESGHYTSPLYLNNNNTWGAWGGYDWMLFNSREESTMALAKCLRENYYDQGLVELEDIGAKYCPDKVATTDRNEAMEWACSVRAIYNEL